MVPKLSETQIKVLELMADGSALVRRSGGFWTTNKVPLNRWGEPEWSVDIRTVRALEKKGLLRRLNVYPEEWRDSRELAYRDNPMDRYKETEERVTAGNPCDTSPTPQQFAGYEGMSVQICRSEDTPWPKDTKFVNKETVEAFARAVGMVDDVRERMYAIYCDLKNVPLGYRLIGAGGPAETLAEAKIVFQPAVALSATNMFCVHNHPSGDPEPSPQDKALLHRFVKIGEIVNVRIVDFLVVGSRGIYSFADHGLI